MTWSPPSRKIDDLASIAVKQKLTRVRGLLLLPNELIFERQQLALSLGRTRVLTLSLQQFSASERQAFVMQIGSDAARMVDLLMDNGGTEFAFKSLVEALADDERTSLAGRVGAAVCDLLMDRLDFRWRANAREFDFKLSKKAIVDSARLPDFVYDTGGRIGFDLGSIAVVEAKGSLSRTKAKRPAVQALARRAYNDQVRHYIGAETPDAVVATGYVVAFGALPGGGTSTVAFASPQKIAANRRVSAYSVAAAAASEMMPAPLPRRQEEYLRQTTHLGGGGGGDSGDGRRGEPEAARPTGRVAFASYETVFMLSGAFRAAEFLRNSISGSGSIGLRENSVQRFLEVEHNGRYLIGLPDDEDKLWYIDFRIRDIEHALPFVIDELRSICCAKTWSFAVEEACATALLRSLAANLDRPPPTVAIPLLPSERILAPVSETNVAVQGDGLSLVDLRDCSLRYREWHLVKGDWV